MKELLSTIKKLSTYIYKFVSDGNVRRKNGIKMLSRSKNIKVERKGEEMK